MKAYIEHVGLYPRLAMIISAEMDHCKYLDKHYYSPGRLAMLSQHVISKAHHPIATRPVLFEPCLPLIVGLLQGEAATGERAQTRRNCSFSNPDALIRSITCGH